IILTTFDLVLGFELARDSLTPRSIVDRDANRAVVGPAQSPHAEGRVRLNGDVDGAACARRQPATGFDSQLRRDRGVERPRIVRDVHVASEDQVIEFDAADVTGNSFKLVAYPTTEVPSRQSQAADANNAVVCLTANAVGATRGYLQTDPDPCRLAAWRREAE